MLNSETKSRLAHVVCLLGLFLRVFFFGTGRSLGLDKAMLALNIVNRSFLELIKP